MNQTIRARIEQIKRGGIPEGYEKTPFGIFPCDWDKSTLKKLGKFAKGKGIPGKEMKNEGIPCVSYGDIYMKYNYHFNQAKSFIDRTTADESIQVGRNTLLFTGTGETAEEIGKCVCYTGSDDIYVGGDIIIFSSVDVSPVFIAYQQYLPFAIKQKAGFGQGHSVVHIYKSDLEKLYCAYPKSKAEQEKIAEILQEQDRLIELKEKLIEEKKKQKQYLMEVLLTGKVRLPGFTDEWVVIPLGQVSDMSSGGTPLTSKQEYFGNDHIWVSIADMSSSGKYIFDSKIKLSNLGLNNCSARLFKKGTVLFAMYASIGECVIAGEECCTSQAILGIVPNTEKLNNEFLYYSLIQKKTSIIAMQQASSQPNLNKGLVQSIQIELPPRLEQIAIVNVLSKADDELDLLQKELEEQKRKKQSLMQLLLTGIVRVKA